MSDQVKDENTTDSIYGPLLLGAFQPSQLVLPQLTNQMGPAPSPFYSPIEIEDLLRANMQNQQNLTSTGSQNFSPAAQANQQFLTPTPAQLFFAGATPNQQFLTPSNQQLLTQSNQQLLTPSNQQLLTASNQQLLTAPNQQFLTAPNQQFLTASNQQLLTASDQQLLKASDQQLLRASNQQLLAGTNLNINFPTDLSNTSAITGQASASIPMLSAAIQQAQLQDQLISNKIHRPFVNLPVQSSFGTTMNIPSSNSTGNRLIPHTHIPHTQSNININPGIRYIDYSKHPDANGPAGGAKGARYKSFPVKLHQMLEDEEFSSCISWMPHGRAWKILRQDEFEEKVIPLYFRHAKFASFTRQVNGWGFRRISEGLDRKCYYHEMFLRGFPHLCARMKRPIESVRNSCESRQQPNFYDIRSFTPLPSIKANINKTGTALNNINQGILH